jgi:hypothetical protein
VTNAPGLSFAIVATSFAGIRTLNETYRPSRSDETYSIGIVMRSKLDVLPAPPRARPRPFDTSIAFTVTVLLAASKATSSADQV